MTTKQQFLNCCEFIKVTFQHDDDRYLQQQQKFQGRQKLFHDFLRVFNFC